MRLISLLGYETHLLFGMRCDHCPSQVRAILHYLDWSEGFAEAILVSADIIDKLP